MTQFYKLILKAASLQTANTRYKLLTYYDLTTKHKHWKDGHGSDERTNSYEIHHAEKTIHHHYSSL